MNPEWIHEPGMMEEKIKQSSSPNPDTQETRILIKKIGHLLRDPSSVILQFCELIIEGYEGEVSGAVKDRVEKMHTLARNTLRTTDRLLDLLTLDIRLPDRSPVDIRQIVHAVAESALPPGGTNRVITRLPKTLPLVLADSERIRELLRILVTTQVQLLANRDVTVTAHVEDGFVICSVKRASTGAQTERLPLEKFIQSRSDDLALEMLFAKRLATQGGGGIWLTGKANPSFHFSLPIAV